jgi:hypothetical protein
MVLYKYDITLLGDLCLTQDEFLNVTNLEGLTCPYGRLKCYTYDYTYAT